MATNPEKYAKETQRIIASTILENSIKKREFESVTITDVQVSGDRQHAYVYWTALVNQKEQDKIKRKLINSKGMLRTVLAKKLKSKRIPDIEFIMDTLMVRTNLLDEQIDNAIKKDKNIAKNSKNATPVDPDPYK